MNIGKEKGEEGSSGHVDVESMQRKRRLQRSHMKWAPGFTSPSCLALFLLLRSRDLAAAWQVEHGVLS
jgi:hypothetical protein